jgi:hypothetical protein
MTLPFVSGAVDHFAYALFFGAVRAAEECAAGFDAVADDSASAMAALGREHVDGAFEAIEVARDAVDENFDRFVVFVAAAFARGAAVAIGFAHV